MHPGSPTKVSAPGCTSAHQSGDAGSLPRCVMNTGLRLELAMDKLGRAAGPRHSPLSVSLGLGSIVVRGSIRRRNIAVAIAAPPVEFYLRDRSRTILQHPYGFPDRIHDALREAEMAFAHNSFSFVDHPCADAVIPPQLCRLLLGQGLLKTQSSEHVGLLCP
jgi:hypothetical protein